MTSEKFNFYERLEKHPILKARFEAILDTTEATGNGDTADAIEERTVNQVCQLGNELMTDWAKAKSEETLKVYKSENSAAQLKKNGKLAHMFWSCKCPRNSR